MHVQAQIHAREAERKEELAPSQAATSRSYAAKKEEVESPLEKGIGPTDLKALGTGFRGVQFLVQKGAQGGRRLWKHLYGNCGDIIRREYGGEDD